MLVADFRDCVTVLRDPAFLTNILGHHRQVHVWSRVEGMCSTCCLFQDFLTIIFSHWFQEIVLIRISWPFMLHPWCRFVHDHFVKSTSWYCINSKIGDVFCISHASGFSHNLIFKLISVKLFWSGIWDCVPVLCVEYFHRVMSTNNRQVVVLVRTRGLCIASRMLQVFLSNMFSNKSHFRM